MRIFNTYGPRMHPNDGRVVSNFIVQALKGDPITLYGEGAQTRSFCYVDDLIAGMVALMEKWARSTSATRASLPSANSPTGSDLPSIGPSFIGACRPTVAAATPYRAYF
jgi:hypothetical protein